jgi:hypothetical protein
MCLHVPTKGLRLLRDRSCSGWRVQARELSRQCEELQEDEWRAHGALLLATLVGERAKLRGRLLHTDGDDRVAEVDVARQDRRSGSRRSGRSSMVQAANASEVAVAAAAAAAAGAVDAAGVWRGRWRRCIAWPSSGLEEASTAAGTSAQPPMSAWAHRSAHATRAWH